MKIKFVSASLVLVCAISIALLSSACGEQPANQTPVISGLNGDPSSVVPGDSSKVTCIASDPDGDRLSYSWSTTGGNLSGGENVVTWTAPDVVGSYSISVTVSDGQGGVADKSYTITVVVEVTDNNPPVIASLSADLKSVEPQRGTTITCEASDPDGDPITYSWWAELGRVEGTGSIVTYVAPLHVGEWDVEVHVRDNKGGNAVKRIEIDVATNEPPEISRVRAQPGVVLPDQSATITCTAEDADGDSLTYTWSAVEGSISGSGNVITWTAPGHAGYFEIEVTVDDSRGGTDTSNDTIQVEGLKVTTTLKPVPEESGSVRSDGNVISLWTVGDDTVNNAIHTYLSFDISRVAKVEEFRGAVLNISTLDKNGTPWADLGDFIIDEVEYGARPLQAADYDLSGTRLERFDSAPATGIDLTPIISRALRDGESRFQIRLNFQVESNNDNSSDNVKIATAELTVSYVKKTE